MYATRSSPKESALLKMLGGLPVNTQKVKPLRQFNFSGYPVLCWIHSVRRSGRRYRIECNVAEDGSLAATFTPILKTSGVGPTIESRQG